MHNEKLLGNSKSTAHAKTQRHELILRQNFRALAPWREIFLYSSQILKS